MVRKAVVEDDESTDIAAEGVETLTNYTRRAEHELWLAKVFKMSQDELIAALAIQKYDHPGYIPSEILVTLARCNYGAVSIVRNEIALTLNARLVLELSRFFRKEMSWFGVLNSSSESKIEAAAYVCERIFQSKVEVCFAEVAFGPFVKTRLLDWLKSQISQKNVAPSIDEFAVAQDEDGSSLSPIDKVVDELALTPEQVLERQQLIRKCRNAVLLLPEKQRTAVTLVYLQEMTQKEASAVMCLSERSIQKYLREALLALKKGYSHVGTN